MNISDNRSNEMVTRCIFHLLVSILIAGSLASAQWSRFPSTNTPVCRSTGDQRSPKAVPYPDGGMIVVWTDQRNGNYDIYAQRLDGGGNPLWAQDGISVCSAPGDQQYPTIARDASGGVFIAWADGRSGASFIYAQRLTGAGVPLWGDGGEIISGNPTSEILPQAISDNSGGAVFIWENASSQWDLAAQHVDSNGTRLWTPINGVTIQSLTDSRNASITLDGAGGIILAWQDWRNGSNWDIYAQRISLANGGVTWTAGGVPLCRASKDQMLPKLVRDGSTGVIVTWQDDRNGTVSEARNDIYAQRVQNDGTPMWASDGQAVCSANRDQSRPSILEDGAGGAFLAWQDARNSLASPPTYDIYAQRINSGGSKMWDTNGVAISIDPFGQDQLLPRVVGDGQGGIVLVWEDHRNGDADFYSARVGGSALFNWSDRAICIAPGDQTAQVVVSDGQGGALVAWQDPRDASGMNIYSQRMSLAGKLGSPPVVSTGAAQSVQSTSAVLRGTINPEGYDALGWFEFRGTQTQQQDLGSDTADVLFSQAVTGLTPDSLYSYRAVSTSDLGGSSGELASFVTLANVPAAVSAIPLDAGTMQLSWQPGAGSNAGFRIYRSTDSTTYLEVGSSSATSYVDTGLQPKTQYWYKVSAVNTASVESGLSPPATGRTYAVLPIVKSIRNLPSAVTGAFMIPFLLSVPPQDTAEVVFDYSTDGGSSFTIPAHVSGRMTRIVSFPPDTLVPDTLFWQSDADFAGETPALVLRLTPKGREGLGRPVSTPPFILDNRAPSFASYRSAVWDTSRVILKWNAAHDVSPVRYSVFRSTQSGVFNFSSPDTVMAETSWVMTDVVNSQPYFFVVRAHDQFGHTDFNTTEATITTPVLCDFNGDGKVASADLAIFARAWGEHNLPVGDIGPVLASDHPPALRRHPDGVIDFEDLVVFGVMWNWSLRHTAFASTALPEETGEALRRVWLETAPGSSAGKPDSYFLRADGDARIQTLAFRLEWDPRTIDLDSVTISEPAGGHALKGLLRDKGICAVAITTPGDAENTINVPGIKIGFHANAAATGDSITVIAEAYSPSAQLIGRIIRKLALHTAAARPASFALMQNYPNPFNSSTRITYEVPAERDVTLKLYDVLGREVRTLAVGVHLPGIHVAWWDGRDDNGHEAVSGVYLYRLTSDKLSETRRLIIVK